MAELKTKKNNASVTGFLNAIEDPQQRKDAKVIHKIMRDATGSPAKMWGGSIVGYGTYRATYASGRETEWMMTGFSPRKQNLSLYIMDGFKEYQGSLKKLGKHQTGKACLYIKRLEDIDVAVLRDMVERSVQAKRGGS